MTWAFRRFRQGRDSRLGRRLRQPRLVSRAPVYEAAHQQEVDASDDPQHIANDLQDYPDFVVRDSITCSAYLSTLRG